jgi:rhodanese-related sulfurtransferase
MRKLLTYATVAILLAAPLARAADTAAPAPAAAQPPAAEYKYKTPKLKRGEIDALLAKPEGLLVIDVRRPDELTKIGGLPVYLSVQAKDLESSLSYIPKDRSIVTVSNHAGRAGAAADLLASHGFKVAGAIGVENYEEEGGTLTKIAPPVPAAAAAQPPAADEYKYKTTRLKRAEIDALLAKPENLLVIDVRRPDEITKTGGLPVYLSIQANDVEKNLAYIPKDRVIVTVANHFGRNVAAGDLLASHGFKVAGAIAAEYYETEGGTLTKIAPPAPAAAAVR